MTGQHFAFILQAKQSEPPREPLPLLAPPSAPAVPSAPVPSVVLHAPELRVCLWEPLLVTLKAGIFFWLSFGCVWYVWSGMSGMFFDVLVCFSKGSRGWR